LVDYNLEAVEKTKTLIDKKGGDRVIFKADIVYNCGH